mmetsp:Transcript_5028/g.7101  ORF Transcript_5028/g.7101 Transcript_5028/m.7101 type:complete len:105 (+) Transcript_5028:147-461(+)|eukprot:CAMPEP_0184478698 /NCGR_PEP_ID=MMETSP0113_2-20130426/659_1 /TAXON_ID=91329 /ORGANISM="Norrisiella sphaerica, Strain BC52" /LENGTH=104 /DNA_ID=CAMNT_0026856585 /DNA_START=151 /DNA_END=465 /DNA_ORIENTATION=+
MPKEKREFDRHSGTGRGKEDPKHGHGKGNWGTYEDTMVDADPKAGRPGPDKKAKGKPITGTRYFDEYKKSSGADATQNGQTAPITATKKTGKMSLAEFQAQGKA